MKSYRLRERLHEELVPHLLLIRGIEPSEHDAFLNPDYDRDGHDPFLLPDMGAAVERLLAAKKNNEKVAVWSDYDADGVPGGVLLSEFLRTMGLAVTHYIPHRHKEGYGLNLDGLDELAAAGVTVVVTVDLGTTEVEAIAHAKTKGIDTIVTDHHLVQEATHTGQNGLVEPTETATRGPFGKYGLPNAVAVINPKRPDSKYPFDGLCGAGVAWKLVQALLQKMRPDGFGVGQEKWMLDLVGIATLSDMVPLRGENRMLAHSGLRVMRRGRRPGLSALLKLLRINPNGLTEDDVTFMISPRINAASRMDSPEVAADLLRAKDPLEAAERATTLNRINDERKGLVAATVKEVNKRVADADLTKSPIIVMGNPNWRPGILGLVANSLVEAHGKPVFLWGREGGDELRGSCRSVAGVNIVELMAKAPDVFGHFGGHSASGGFSVREEMVHELLPRLSLAHAEVANKDSGPVEVLLDRELSLGELAQAHVGLRRLAPFGVGNEKPLFMFSNLTVAAVKTFGKTQNHLGVTLEQEGVRVEGVSFFSTPDSFSKKITAGERADLVGHVEADWRGRPRIRVVDII